MKKLFQHLICKLYYKFCFREDKQAQLFIVYYFPGIVKNMPAGTYSALKLNKELSEAKPIVDFVNYGENLKLK